MIQVSTWIKANWFLVIFLVLIASAFILLRSKPSNVASFDELEVILGVGKPTVIEFYSNF
jgi:hypothetical protein